MSTESSESSSAATAGRRRRARLLVRLVALGVSTGLALFAANLVAASAEPDRLDGTLSYRTLNGETIDITTPEGIQLAASLMEVTPNAPRHRMRFKPNVSVKLCYHGMQGGDLDDDGCVTMTTNSLGLRDREEVLGPQPEGRRQILCIGDSTTVGWGVPIDRAWIRLAESELRKHDDQLRLVNGGAAGNITADEHLAFLSHNIDGLQVDAVLVTLCLNDLLPINGGMSHFDPQKQSAVFEPTGLAGALQGFALGRAFARAALLPDPLELDPARDWVGELLAIPVAERPGWARELGPTLWGDGGVQSSLLAMRDHCRERGRPFGVAIWPFLQQLEDRISHPFTPIHDRVREFCAANEIPFLDLLDPFLGRTEPELWVSPKDMHGNSAAHAIAAPHVAEFIDAHLLP